mgnify:CR=1 FL=1
MTAEEEAAAAPPSCRDGMEAVGATPDGAWTVCERTLSPDPLTGKLVPAGQLECVPARCCAAGRGYKGRCEYYAHDAVHNDARKGASRCTAALHR